MSAVDSTGPAAVQPDVTAVAGGKPEVPSWRLVVTLAVAGALAAMLLSLVYEATLPAIQANKARVLREAVGIVLESPATVVSYKVTADGLEPEDEIVYEVDTRSMNRVFFGWDADGMPKGFAVVGAAYGYGSDPILLIFGYDATTHEVLGLSVLEHKETPGIGTKIETDPAFADQWWRPVRDGAPRRGGKARQVTSGAPLVAMRSDKAPTGDVHEVDTISGATISSRAVLKVVSDAIAILGDKLVTPEPVAANRGDAE